VNSMHARSGQERCLGFGRGGSVRVLVVEMGRAARPAGGREEQAMMVSDNAGVGRLELHPSRADPSERLAGSL
jgi:hypothetical protein